MTANATPTPDTDGWVAVAESVRVGPGDIAEGTLGGEEVVVWRTAGGVPCVMAARCPHQWSHLWDWGEVAGEELVCLSHFWTFRTDGSGWKENFAGRQDRKGNIETYACQETNGKIWARPTVEPGRDT